MAMKVTKLRWDWIVFMPSLAALDLLSWHGRVFGVAAVLGGYSLGRWDEGIGRRWR